MTPVIIDNTQWTRILDLKPIVSLMAFLLSALIFQACSNFSPITLSKKTNNPYLYPKYEETLEIWSRDVRIYDRLEVKLIATLTYLSEDFREAYTEEYALSYQMDDTEKAKMRMDQKSAAHKYHDIIMAVYVPDETWDDFSKSKSIWKIFIKDQNGLKIDPVEIRRIRVDNKINDYFYPGITPWKTIYRIRFKMKDPNWTETASLNITSMKGFAKVIWKNQE